MAEERSLPGWPKKRLVKDVRRRLWSYGIRPTRSDIWRAAWAWADAIARSYWHTNWPSASEIATQYILLLLAEMKSSHMLKLPYRAQEIVPPQVAALFPLRPLVIADARPSRRRKRLTPGTQAGSPTLPGS